MALEELIVPGVRHGGRVGELHALADEIRFAEGDSETVRHDYTPAYTEERDERDGSTVRLKTAGGVEDFGFEREVDAESFERLVAGRVGS